MSWRPVRRSAAYAGCLAAGPRAIGGCHFLIQAGVTWQRARNANGSRMSTTDGMTLEPCTIEDARRLLDPLNFQKYVFAQRLILNK